jgi:hypothetical protein
MLVAQTNLVVLEHRVFPFKSYELANPEKYQGKRRETRLSSAKSLEQRMTLVLLSLPSQKPWFLGSRNKLIFFGLRRTGLFQDGTGCNLPPLGKPILVAVCQDALGNLSRVCDSVSGLVLPEHGMLFSFMCVVSCLFVHSRKVVGYVLTDTNILNAKR